jgi:hypothetical protein
MEQAHGHAGTPGKETLGQAVTDTFVGAGDKADFVG